MSDTPKPALPARLAQTRALRDFLAAEVVGGIVLVAAATVAIVWANSPWQAGYRSLWSTELSVALGNWDLTMSVREWVNQGLMSIFFLVIGLEVKRESVQGELRDARRAALPVIAAIGGMAVPALLYALANIGGTGTDGWAVPMGYRHRVRARVLALIPPGLPASLRVFQ